MRSPLIDHALTPLPQLVLVVDDRDFTPRISRMLASRDYEVLCAHNPPEALELACHKDVPVALVDRRFGTANGIDLIARLRAEHPGITCVAMTAGGDSDADALPGWAYDCVRKPVEARELLPAMDRCFERMRLRRETEFTSETLKRRNENMSLLDGRLKVMVESARTFAACHEFRNLSSLLLERVATLMAAEGGNLFLCREDGLERVATLEPGVVPTRLSFPLRERSVFERVYRERRPILVDDIRNATDLVLSGGDGYRNGSFIVFPLIDEEQNVVGLLSLHNKKSPPFTTQDLDLGQIMVYLGSEALQKQLTADALRVNEARLARLATAVEHADENVMITDTSGKIVYVNPSFTRITGYAPEEAIGENPRILQSGEQDDAFYKEMWNTLRSGSTWRGRLSNRRKDGSLILQASSITPIRDPSGNVSGYVSVNRDVTREVQVETRIAQTQKLEAIGTLAGGIAHDFNNILMAILGYSGLAMMEVSEGTPLRDKLQSIHEAGNRAAELTRQILAFSRPTQQIREIVQGKPIVKEALKLLRASLPSTIEIRESFVSESSVLSEPAQIHQVMMNLCTNAGFAMRDSGGVLEVGLSDVDLDAAFLRVFPGTAPGTFLRLTVRDTGVGMTREVQERIFDPFFTTRPSGEGTGMGLSVVHGIVRSHGGFITVRSEPGQGTEFAVHLPVVANEVVEAPGIELTSPRGIERILFVDDEEVQANMAREMLGMLGYRVTAVSDSRKALAMFLSAPDAYDMVVTDVTMPGMPGDALARAILQERPDLPIIFCTGYSDRISESRAKSIGGRGFLLKPYLMREIALKIREILDGPRRGQ